MFANVCRSEERHFNNNKKNANVCRSEERHGTIVNPITIFEPDIAGLRRGMAQAGLLAEDQACQPITRPGDQYDNQVHHECDDDNHGECGDGG